MKELTLQIIVNAKNPKQFEEFYNFQKEYSGNLFVSVPTSIKEWRKQR